MIDGNVYDNSWDLNSSFRYFIRAGYGIGKEEPGFGTD